MPHGMTLELLIRKKLGMNREEFAKSDYYGFVYGRITEKDRNLLIKLLK
ncbi:MAG: hypothetical protein WBG30_00360 [Psychrilyobacter sp.]